MADGLEITGDLTNQFAQLGDIKSVTARLSSRLGEISRANLQAAGTDDDYAKAYHKNVDANQQNLVDLVDGIGSLFETTGGNGQAVAKSFSSVNDDSAAVVGAMHMDALPLTSASVSPLLPAQQSVTERRSTADEPTLARTERKRDILVTPAQPLTEPALARAERVRGTMATPALPLGEFASMPAEPALATEATPALPRGEMASMPAHRTLANEATPALPRGEFASMPAEPALATEATPVLPRSEMASMPAQRTLATEATPALPRGETTTAPTDQP